MTILQPHIRPDQRAQDLQKSRADADVPTLDAAEHQLQQSSSQASGPQTAPSGASWWPLRPFWWLLEPPRGFWTPLVVPGAFWSLLVASGTFWWFLEPPGGFFWWLIQTSSGLVGSVKRSLAAAGSSAPVHRYTNITNISQNIPTLDLKENHPLGGGCCCYGYQTLACNSLSDGVKDCFISIKAPE